MQQNAISPASPERVVTALGSTFAVGSATLSYLITQAEGPTHRALLYAAALFSNHRLNPQQIRMRSSVEERREIAARALDPSHYIMALAIIAGCVGIRAYTSDLRLNALSEGAFLYSLEHTASTTIVWTASQLQRQDAPHVRRTWSMFILSVKLLLLGSVIAHLIPNVGQFSSLIGGAVFSIFFMVFGLAETSDQRLILQPQLTSTFGQLHLVFSLGLMHEIADVFGVSSITDPLLHIVAMFTLAGTVGTIYRLWQAIAGDRDYNPVISQAAHALLN